MNNRRSMAHLLLAAAYVVSGKLGLMLALAPGYASPIFPPAGIAVAAAFIGGRRTLPWVFLGSLLLNIWVDYSAHHQINATGFAAASAIAAASMLQAAFGGWWLRRVIGYPVSLDRGRDILYFLLSAPAVCLTSATLSISALTALGIFDTASFATNWAAWWVGDTLGVVVMLPLVMIVAGEPHALWQSRTRTVAIPMLLISALFVAIFLKANRWEQNDSLMEFRQLSQQAVSRVQTQLEGQESLLEQTAGLFIHDKGGHVTREEFHRFVENSLARFPAIQALEWAPHVDAAHRPGFEAAQRKDFPDFEIRERNAAGQLQHAGERVQFYPVTYAEPVAGNEPALGFDLASTSDRRTALTEAVKRGVLVATLPIRLVQERQQQAGMLLLLAVNNGNNDSGVVLTVLRMDDFMDKLLLDTRSMFYTRLIDLDGQKTLYDSFVPGSPRALYERTFSFGARQYRLETVPTPAYFMQQRGWQSWSVLAAGLLGTGLFGALLLLGTGYTARIEVEVKNRTRELKESESRFRNILEHAPIGMGIAALDGRFMQINRAFCAIVGYAKDELKKMTIREITHPEDLSLDLANKQRLISGEISSYQMDKRYIRKDGQTVWVQVTASIERDASGMPLYLIGQIEDITGRRHAAELLRQSSEEIADLYNHAPCGYHSLDKDGVICMINDTELAWLGYARDEVAGRMKWSDLLTPASVQTFLENFPRLKKEGGVHDLEIEIICKNGTVLPTLINATAIYDSGGDFVRSRSTVFDITERKRLEQQFLRRLRHRDIMERITRISFESATVEELLGKVLDEVLAVFDADRAWFLYPCDPDAPSWSVLMERTRPEWPGAFARGMVIPMTPEVAGVFREVLASAKPLPYGPVTSRCVPAAIAGQFSIRSQIQMALHPRVDSPWAFGLHHCAQARAYDEDDLLIFNDIGQRVADALSSMIILKNLRESEENLNRAQAVGQIGSWLLNIPANRLEWSAKTFRMFGIPRQDAIDLETFAACVHPDDRDFVLKAWGEAMAGAPYDIEHRIVAGGQVRWVRERALIERDAEGRPLTGIGTVQDITERKQVEEKLRASEQKFMRLFMEIPIPLGVAGKEGVITHFNNKFTDIFGYTVDDVPTLDEWWLKAYPDEAYRRWVLDNWNNAVANAEKEGMNVESAEYNVTCKNGAERIVIIGGSAVEGGVLAIFNDITERKKAEEELRFKAQLLDSVSDSIFVHENGNFVYLNEAAWKTRGYTLEELMGMNLHDLDTPEYAALLESRRKEMMEKGQIIFESAHRLKDGSVMPIEVTARIGEFGGRKLILGVARDITERKNTGKKLAATLKELESIIQVNPDILYVINPKGELIKWNPTLEKLCGLTPQQMMNRPATEFVCEEDRPTVMRGIAEVFEKGSASIEVRFIRNDGALVTHLCNGAIWKNPDGEVMGFVGVGKDITERKAAEEKLIKSEAILRTILDNVPYLIWLKDTAGCFIAANEAFFKTTGQKRMQDVLGKTDLDLWPKELAEEYRADDAEVMATRRQKYIEEPAFDGGKMTWVETFKTPVIDENGNVLGTTGFSCDITERKEYEEELKRSNTELEQFSYAVSHDMRQPLRMISSYLQLLERNLSGQLDGEKRSYFNFAIEGAKRIDQMLVALLEYSRVGRKGEPPMWIESRAVLDETLQFLQPAITEARARLDITGEWPRIFACHDEIQRLLQNLIGNAAKFRVVGRTPEITVASEVVKNEWHLCVADNGVGIIPDQIKRLFKVFQRLQLRDAYEGTGIGLALCRKIAEHHKGRIWAESVGDGLGSKFYVVLPVLHEKTTLLRGDAA